MANNTGNPIGSDAYPDFQDNVKSLDHLVAGEAPSYTDRFGKNRKSWAGIESEFSSSQEQRNDTFNQFMINTQFEIPAIPFVEGIPLEISRPAQLISYEGQLYSVKLPATFPVVLSGAWDVAVDSLTPREEASLRQQLSSSNGSTLSGFKEWTVYDELSTGPIPLTRYGCVGDFNGTTGRNNKVEAKKWWEAAVSHGSGYIPHGNFLIDVTDADVTDVTVPESSGGRDYAFFTASNIDGLVISGPGKIHIRCSSSTKRVLLASVKHSKNFNFLAVGVEGDLVKEDAKPNSEIGVAMGIMLYDCESSSIQGCHLKGLIVPVWVTGQPTSPATVTDTSKACRVTHNVFENFEQNSTFGAGAYGLIFAYNTCINPYTAFKVSQNPVGVAAAGKSGVVHITNNLVYWTPDAKFSSVFFEPTTSSPATGVTVECASVDVVIEDNIITFEGITAPSLPPYSNAAPIVIFESPNRAPELATSRVVVRGGSLIASDTYGTRFAVDSTSRVRDMTITGVTGVGGIRVQTGTAPLLPYGDLEISVNTLRGLPSSVLSIRVGLGLNRNVIVKGNTLLGTFANPQGDLSQIFVSQVVATNVIVNDNVAPGGAIGTYTDPAITCENFTSSGNILGRLAVGLSGVKRVKVENECVTTGAATTITLDAATVTAQVCRVSVGGSCAGPTGVNCTTALSINGGILRIDSSEMFANSGSAFVLGAGVLVQGGELYGNGDPSFAASMGVKWTNLGAGANGIWDKNTATGTTGWKNRYA